MRVMVIGGGASGMMAALTASEQKENEVLLLERQARLSKKLLATGNGRCNLSNRNMAFTHYHGEVPQFCAYALRKFGVEETLAYFRTLGLLTVTEDSGRIYPRSDSANSVADVLRLPLEQRENVCIVTGAEVRALCRKKGKFHATAAERSLEADRVIVCAGGVAGGKLGGTDLGYKLLSSFGHSRTRLAPALVQLKTDTTFVRALKGVRCTAEIRCGAERRVGEVQFTDYGVSGPAVFELSRSISTGSGERTLLLDLLPDLEETELLRLLHGRAERMPALQAENLLTGMLHNRLGRTVLRACELPQQTPCGALSEAELREICKKIKCFALPILGTMGMESAQVTAGGIRTSEFDERTMESRLCRGLYAAGEVLDIDGDCGGYNLQWAWSSGRLAGEMRSEK